MKTALLPRAAMRLSGPPMLVTGLAKQAPRPKRIGSLTLPMASFGGPLIAGVIRQSRIARIFDYQKTFQYH